LRRESAVRQQKEAELARASRISMASLLSASLAHELNQPLGAIVCSVQAAELYLNQAAPPLDELRGLLTDIEADGKRAGQIIHRLRALYQKSGSKRTALQLNEVVQETTDLMHSEFLLKGASVELALAPTLPLVLGNHIELQQVVINLLVNALQHRLATLTPREREVFDRVIKGLLNKQIAGELGASEQTIKVHRARVMQKMQVVSVAELVQGAVKLGVLKA
jgi:C4-dicarboxylate-specific signal transduction histidine kinase